MAGRQEGAGKENRNRKRGRLRENADGVCAFPLRLSNAPAPFGGVRV